MKEGLNLDFGCIVLKELDLHGELEEESECYSSLVDQEETSRMEPPSELMFAASVESEGNFPVNQGLEI